MVIPLLIKIAELFLILFAAAALVRFRVLKAEDSRVLSKLSLYFITPCVIFNAFQKEVTPEILRGLLMSLVLAVIFHLLFFALAAALKRFWKATEVERASVIFTNAGNLVIPLVSYIFKDSDGDMVIYTSAYILVFNVLFWTVGVRMFDRENAPGAKKILLNPNLLAIAAGLVLLFTPISLPEPLSVAFSDVAAMIGPLSMMITGMVVGSMKLRDLFANRRVFGVILFRMVAASGLAVLAAALFRALGFAGSGKALVIIPLLSAIAPSASNINQVAILYNKDAKYASAINVLTTLSCIATIPLWDLVYEALAV